MSKDTATLPPMLISVKDKDGVKDQTSFTLLGRLKSSRGLEMLGLAGGFKMIYLW
jgi:hypothetical protein